MMHRLATVTYGYLNYTFICMVAAAIVFFLAGIAVIQPRSFLVAAVVAVIAFFVVRDEVKRSRVTRVPRKR